MRRVNLLYVTVCRVIRLFNISTYNTYEVNLDSYAVEVPLVEKVRCGAFIVVDKLIRSSSWSSVSVEERRARYTLS